MASKRATLLAYLRDTVLAGITTGNGYNFTVGAAKRGIYEADYFPQSQLPAVLIARTEEDRKNLTQNQFLGTLRVTLLAYVKTATGVDGLSDELENMIEDLTVALETDRLQGGNAKWTEVKKVVTSEGDQDSVGIVALTVEFDYASEGTTP